MAVGYEHLRRGNLKGMRSLLGQGTKKLANFTRRTGIKELRERALRDRDRALAEELTLDSCKPPKIMVHLDGSPARIPARAIEITIPKDASPRTAGGAHSS